MSIQDKTAKNENKFGPKAQHYVKLTEIISKCFLNETEWIRNRLILFSKNGRVLSLLKILN